MSRQTKHLYEFGPFRLDAAERLLLRQGEVVPLTPKAFDLLLALVERHGHLVEKDELFKAVWPDAFVEESNLSSNIALIRKALGDGENGQKFIETVPKRGYRFVAEVREVLSETAEDLAQQTIGQVPDNAPAVPSTFLPGWVGRRKWTIIVITLGLLVGITAVVLIAMRRQSPSSMPKIVPFTTLPGPEGAMSFSPDGNQLVFVWDGGSRTNTQHLYAKQVGNEAVRQLTTGPGWYYAPAWSPDGREIAFLRTSAKGRGLYVIPSLGGAERSLNEQLFTFAFPIAWTPDGKGIVIQGNEAANAALSIYFVVRETGEMRKLTNPPQGTPGDRYPAVSPDGKMIVFCRATGVSQSELYLMPVSGGEPERLTSDHSLTTWPIWTPDGREIIFLSNRRDGSGSARVRLWRMPANGGEPQQIEIGAQKPTTIAISKQGNRLAWTESFNDFNIWQTELDGTQKQPPRQLLISTRSEHSPQYSPDGSKIAFVSDRSGGTEIWTCDGAGGNLLQLTNSGSNGSPRWSPDGQQIVHDSVTDGNGEIYVINAEGGSSRRLTNDAAEDIVPSWSRDGQWIYFCSNRTGSQQVWKMPAAGGQAVQVTKHGGFENVESPDGRYLYYLKGRGIAGIWRIPTAGGEETLVLDQRSAGWWRHWAVTEQGIYFATAEQYPHPLIEFFDFATGQTKTVFTLGKPIHPTPPGLAVSPDGRWLIWSQQDQEGGDILLMENFR